MDIHLTTTPGPDAVSPPHRYRLEVGKFGLRAVALPAVLLVSILLGEAPPAPGDSTASPVEVAPGSSAPSGSVVPRAAYERRRREPVRPPSAPLVAATLSPVIVLDPGHGGRGDPGTMAANGVREKDLTLDIARRLRAFLQRAGLRVVQTRTEDRLVPLAERVRLANEAGGDIFVSIHVNWLEGSARGIETFHLQRGQPPTRWQASAKLAEAVHRELRAYIQEVTPSVVDRGVKEGPFKVLSETWMPAVLAEVSTLSNDQEADLLALPAYRQYIALALYAGIRSYADGLAVGAGLGS